MTNPIPIGRWAIYGGAAAAALGAGFGAAVLFKPGTEVSPPVQLAVALKPIIPDARPAAALPWYKTQAPPPALDRGKSLAARTPPPPAVEENLPGGVYVAPAPVAAPAPIAATSELAADVPWRRFAVTAPAPGKRPLIAIVIDDAGVDIGRTGRIIQLAAPLTLSFLTYAPDLARQTAAARARGHELMIHMSMEPLSTSVDPGPNVLRGGDSEDQQDAQLRWGLGRFDGYVGLNNHMGSRFTADSRGMTRLLRELKRRGLLFLDSRTTTNTVGAALAADLGVPFAERDVFLDHDPTLTNVNRQLAELEAVARRQGYAIAIGHPREATLAALAAWLPLAREKGFALVPLSAIVARRRAAALASREDGRR